MQNKLTKKIVLGVLAAFAVLVFSAYLVYRSPVILAKRFPDLQTSSYTGHLSWSDSKGLLATDMEITQSELQQIFGAHKLHRTILRDPQPEVCFSFHTHDKSDYSIVVSQNGMVSLEKINDPKGSHTYWIDDGALFEDLYECHLKNGGSPCVR